MRTCLITLAVLLLAGPAAAVKPQRFVHTNEADFEPGAFEDTVATNLGDLKLASASEPLGGLPESVTVVYDFATVGDKTFVAAGPEGKVFMLTDGELEEGDDFTGEQVFALAEVDRSLVIGVSGEDSRLVVVTDAVAAVVEVALPDVRYVWDLLPVGDGDLLVATGPDGKVFRVEGSDEGGGDPVVTEVLDTAQANVLCLAGSPTGDSFPVYAGTDTDGIVYRLDADGNTFALFDADEPEVGAIVVGGDGSVYVGTADAEQAVPGRMDGAIADDTGRPDETADETEDGVAGDAEADPYDDETQAVSGDGETVAPNATADVDDAAVDTETLVADDAEAAEANDAEAADQSADALADNGAGADAAPTPEQYDALRDEVRKRLETARKSGSLAGGAGGAAPQSTRASNGGNGGSDKEGNAVYRIDPQGFTTEVFRESVMVLDLLLDRPDRLLIATGSEGQLFAVDLETQESSILHDYEDEQIVALAQANGSVLLGTANTATVRTLAADLAETGTYTSDALDATQTSLWGKLLITAEVPAGASVEVETRSGNVADPEVAPWSSWSDAGVVTPDAVHTTGSHEAAVTAPPARFLQYRLTLNRGGGEDSPTVERVELAYVLPNLPPKVTTLTAAYPDPPAPGEAASSIMNVEWEAADDNGDRLIYAVQYRPLGAETWLTAAEDLDGTSHEWDTRTVPNGRYHVRVRASDRLDNPAGSARVASRRSEVVAVDNAPPALEELNVALDGRTATVTGRAVDALAPVIAVSYKLDDAEQYRPALPDDLIYDSTSEAWSVTLSGLSRGGHVLTVRTRDARGNAAYESVIFTVK